MSSISASCFLVATRVTPNAPDKGYGVAARNGGAGLGGGPAMAGQPGVRPRSFPLWERWALLIPCAPSICRFLAAARSIASTTSRAFFCEGPNSGTLPAAHRSKDQPRLNCIPPSRVSLLCILFSVFIYLVTIATSLILSYGVSTDGRPAGRCLGDFSVRVFISVTPFFEAALSTLLLQGGRHAELFFYFVEEKEEGDLCAFGGSELC